MTPMTVDAPTIMLLSVGATLDLVSSNQPHETSHRSAMHDTQAKQHGNYIRETRTMDSTDQMSLLNPSSLGVWEPSCWSFPAAVLQYAVKRGRVDRGVR